MSIRNRWYIVICVAFALPLVVRAQPPGNLPAAGVEMGAAALQLHTAAQEVLPGTPGGDALIRDLQTFRTAVDEFRTAMDVGQPPPDVGRLFSRIAGAYRLVEGDIRQLPPGMPPYLAERVRRFERAFNNLAGLMGGY